MVMVHANQMASCGKRANRTQSLVIREIEPFSDNSRFSKAQYNKH